MSREHASRLALEFDRSFAEPIREHADAGEPALAIRLGDDGYVLVVAELASVAPAASIVPLPGGPPEQLGVAGLRGDVVAVFSLPHLLGYAAARAEHRWIALLAGPRPIGVAFSELEGQRLLRAPDVALPAGARRHVRGVVVFAGEAAPRAVVDLPSVAARIAAAGEAAGR